jgi:hypothetical protein
MLMQILVYFNTRCTQKFQNTTIYALSEVGVSDYNMRHSPCPVMRITTMVGDHKRLNEEEDVVVAVAEVTVKGKGIPETGSGGPQGCEMSRIPHIF